jgi:ATP-dependent Lon protease
MEEEDNYLSSTDFTDDDQDLISQLRIDSKTQDWKFAVLQLKGNGGIGKTCLVEAIAKEYNIEVSFNFAFQDNSNLREHREKSVRTVAAK